MKEVADLAGVSITTVSHVINETRTVSDDLREKVYAAMENLSYQPNALARGLRLKRTQILGLVIPDGTNPYFAEVARSIEDTSYKKGYSVIICNSDGNLEKEQNYIEVLVSKQVDGVILVAAGMSTSHMKALQSAGMPLVLVDRDSPNIVADSVQIDNEYGGYIATRHLLDLGHRRIACLAGPSEVTPSGDRVLGYSRALKEADIVVEKELVRSGDFHSESGYRFAKEFLKMRVPPTAIFACNDLMAFGALGAAAELGFRIPQDLSIVGFDDIKLTEYTNPPLTTIAQPRYEMGELAVRFLLERIKNTDIEPRNPILPCRIVIRKSSGPSMIMRSMQNRMDV